MSSGKKTLYTFHGEHDSQSHVVCQMHAREMPPVSETVTTGPADEDLACEFCAPWRVPENLA